MTRIEKAIHKVSDMREFYRRIPKFAGRVAESRPTPYQTFDASRDAATGWASGSDLETRQTAGKEPEKSLLRGEGGSACAHGQRGIGRA